MTRQQAAKRLRKAGFIVETLWTGSVKVSKPSGRYSVYNSLNEAVNSLIL